MNTAMQRVSSFFIFGIVVIMSILVFGGYLYLLIWFIGLVVCIYVLVCLRVMIVKKIRRRMSVMSM